MNRTIALNNARTFSLQSESYARYRPTYPAALFSFLSSLVGRCERAWDCATGSGQAALGCAEFFEQVAATDISTAQARQGISHRRVNYAVAPAEAAPFAANAFDLVLVAQALHWFDLEEFYRETRRVLRPGGILAVCGYGFFTIQPDLDRIITQCLLEPIDRFWAEGNRQLMHAYRNLPFPFDEISALPELELTVEWNLARLLEYLRTWSAVKRCVSETGRDPVRDLENALKPLWQPAEDARTVLMPLFLRVGRK